ncbi:zinc finger protein 236 [Tribolium castaneum]|uniref:Zinc finger protein 236-like Protein n=1 Tax=Tribolium castaneum TaxID=7070 RepID=A0A139WL74_TRICA|nr:PREDICTED: zinc finger protein 236-like [Tribolium castaneum]KYB28575.1 Zinc finger protein 236-like Protein [Tribolium castaneum]|eukprot:XP_015833653.1 PREDICTED: zinc finger protein 236-like [Tribolium castaneum]
MAEGSYMDNISTFVALPVDTLENNILQKPEQFRIIKNAIIKKLSDGSVCIIDANEVNEGLPQEIEVTYLPPVDVTPVANATPDKPTVTVNKETSPKQTYKCSKCKEVFEKLVLYRKHMMWHRSIKKFKCEKCSVGYNVETNLKIHMAMHSEGKPTCPICNISFQRLASLKSHLMLHQVEELCTCEECGAEFEKEEELEKHFHSHLENTAKENNNLVCTYCSVQLDDQKSYKEHISHHVKVKKMVLSGKKSRKTHGNKEYPHVCNICSKSFSRVSLLERHSRIHSGEKPFLCQYCFRGFNQKGTLQIHYSKHTGHKPFQCTLCSAKFSQKGNLRVHVEKTHTAPLPGVKMYKCSHCTCIFKKIASLNVHITKFHSNGEDSTSISSVMNQLKELEQVAMPSSHSETVQENERVDDPNTSFVRLAESFLDGTVRRYLVKQKKVNDVRWYICNYCNKEFKKPSDLIRHTRVHTREKPFVCNKCGASFSLKTSLFSHVKTHLGNNNYFCSICMKKFSSARSVNLHLRRHSEKPQYKCLSCNKSFSSIQKAKLHYKEAHSGRSEKDSEIILKQPLVNTPDGLLPVPPPKSVHSTNSKQIQCPICCVRFSKVPNLKRHMLLHNGGKKHKCGQCMKSYYTAHALKEHVLCHSGVKNFGCKVCGKKYTTASLLKRHTLSHSTNKPYVCPYCSKNFKSVMLCRKHMNVHKKDLQITVQNISNETKNLDIDKPKLLLIPDSISNSGLLTNNQDPLETTNLQLITQPNVNEIVNPTDQQFYEITPNSIQIITNSDKDLVQDPNQIQTIFINCDNLPLGDNLYSTNTNSVLFDPMNENTFNINALNGDFSTQNTETFNDGQTNSTSTDKVSNDNLLTTNIPLYPQSELNLLFNLDTEFVSNNCDLPDININEVPDLNVEPAKENDEAKNRMTCDKCSKVFTNKKTFLKHVNSHKDRQKVAGFHQCSFCEKSFKKHSDLIRHIRTHTGEKPFACDKCEKKFSLKSTLLSHQRTHNPISHKQFNCVVCNSFFTSKSSLKVHMSVHTGDKSYKCSFCSAKFRTAAHRKSHENNYHVNPSKKKTKNKVTNLLESVAMDVLGQTEQTEQSEQVGGLENVLVVQEPLNLLDDSGQNALTESTQLEPLLLQQLQSNFLLQYNLVSSSLIQLDDGTLVNFKTVNTDQDLLQETVKPPSEPTTPAEKLRNLECDICHKKYASKDVLRKHKKIHGVDKKFRCTKCEKGFDTEEDLEKHKRIHEGYRPYSCFYCANSFSKEHSLATHLKRIHNVSLKDNLLLCDLK